MQSTTYKNMGKVEGCPLIWPEDKVFVQLLTQTCNAVLPQQTPPADQTLPPHFTTALRYPVTIAHPVLCPRTCNRWDDPLLQRKDYEIHLKNRFVSNDNANSIKSLLCKLGLVVRAQGAEESRCALLCMKKWKQEFP